MNDTRETESCKRSSFMHYNMLFLFSMAYINRLQKKQCTKYEINGRMYWQNINVFIPQDP